MINGYVLFLVPLLIRVLYFFIFIPSSQYTVPSLATQWTFLGRVSAEAIQVDTGAYFEVQVGPRIFLLLLKYLYRWDETGVILGFTI